jgi:16S rRNA (guanine966-N2)-methyltransferase
MRITGGQWRGRRLQTGRDDAVRPTTDRVREALGNLVGDDLAGAPVADLCCGSGALGLEALSRGAAHVDFVDLSPSALSGVRANLAALAAPEATWRLHRADASRWLRRRLGRPGPALVVLADPPYDGRAAADLVAVLAANGPTPPALVVLEHPAGTDPLAAAGPTWQRRVRTYGGTALTLMRPAAGAVPEDDHA